jgi:prepilin-type N-terminal cleavage/methylation domain-containing protein
LDSNCWHKSSEAGFTLIEVLIAITLLSFVMLSIITVTDSSIQTKDRVISEDNEYLQVETAMDRISWDISQAYSPLYFSHEMKPENLTEQEGEAYNKLVSNYQSNDRFAFPSYDALPVPLYKYEDKTTITFFTNSNRRKLKNIKQSNYAWVQYTLDTDDDISSSEEGVAKGILVRKFMPNDVFNPESIDWSNVKSQVLLRNVEKVLWEFWNPETRKWVDNLDLIKNGNHLIRGIKLTFEWVDPDGIVVPFIRVFRPLYPQFEPEDMYKLEKQNDATAESSTTEDNGSSGGSN